MKPVVHYIGPAEHVWRGYEAARLVPIDHPDKLLNNESIITSRVLEWTTENRITTRNTVYVPVPMPNLDKHRARARESVDLVV